MNLSWADLVHAHPSASSTSVCHYSVITRKGEHHSRCKAVAVNSGNGRNWKCQKASKEGICGFGEENRVALHALILKAVAEKFVLVSFSYYYKSTVSTVLAGSFFAPRSRGGRFVPVPVFFDDIQGGSNSIINHSFGKTGVLSVVQFHYPQSSARI